jgi:hypothetical protein
MKKSFEYAVLLTPAEAMEQNGHGLFSVVESILTQVGADDSCETQIHAGGNNKQLVMTCILPQGTINYSRKREIMNPESDDAMRYKYSVLVSVTPENSGLAEELISRLEEMKEKYISLYQQSWLTR